MVFFSGCVIEHRPQELLRLCKRCVVEGVAAQVSLVEFLHKAVAGFIRKDHFSPARTGNSEARSSVLAPFREAIVCGTEFTA